MSRPSGGNGELARGRERRGGKGAALIGLAVIVGVFLLQRVDTSKAGSTHVRRRRRPRPPRTVHVRPPTTTTSTTPATPAKTPDQLKVIVLNGGAPTGAAATLRTKLQQAGYTNQPQASTWTGHTQTGKTGAVQAGLDREAVALSQQTALQGVEGRPVPDAAAAVERRRRLRRRRRRLAAAVATSGTDLQQRDRAAARSRRRSRSTPSRARLRHRPVGRRVDAAARELGLVVDRAARSRSRCTDGSTGSRARRCPCRSRTSPRRRRTPGDRASPRWRGTARRSRGRAPCASTAGTRR